MRRIALLLLLVPSVAFAQTWTEDNDGSWEQTEINNLETTVNGHDTRIDALDTSGVQLDDLLSNCTIEDDSTPIPDSCVGDGSDSSGAGSGGVNETYGSGWNADTDAPEKDDVYDWGHVFDTDDDGKVNVVDQATAGILVINSSGVIQAPDISDTEAAELEDIVSNCTIENDGTPIPDSCVGDGSDGGTAPVDEAFASGWNADTGAPEKDDVYDWGHDFDTDDDGEVNELDTDATVPTVSPGTDDSTKVASTAFVHDAVAADVSTPPAQCFPEKDADYTPGILSTHRWTLWRPGMAITVSSLWCIADTTTIIQIHKMNGSGDEDMFTSNVTCNVTPGTSSSVTSTENNVDSDDWIDIEIVTTGGTSTLTPCLTYTID